MQEHVAVGRIESIDINTQRAFVGRAQDILEQSTKGASFRATGALASPGLYYGSRGVLCGFRVGFRVVIVGNQGFWA